jgi:ATP-dependent helicase/nuclease subunit A
MTPRRPAPDQAERDAFVHARGVNVLGDAGAGTGKTTLLVERLVGLVAPADDAAAIALPRIAAITFTRKAAGELRLRVREALLAALAEPALTPLRQSRLASALAALDTAHVGTIHGFADRLLRLRPVEAALSPTYQIVEDEAELVAETFSVLMQAVEAGTLASELAGDVDAVIAEEAQATIVDALRAGLRAETLEYQHHDALGLDRLFARFIATRDVEPVVPAVRRPDPSRLGQLADELASLAAGSSGPGRGSRFVARAVRELQRLQREEDPVRVLQGLLQLARTRKFTKRNDFAGDDAGWKAWKAFDGDDGVRALRATALRDDLLRPFHRWMGRRLVRAAPAVLATYERVKARRRAVDQVDLLLQLRDLLRDRRDVRAEYQALFDHVLVDEFQDTDPLQAEIVLYLCEDGAKAWAWNEVALRPGKLTVVGDPKQSIYRFRRADIAVYDAFRRVVQRGAHRIARLTANFRSEPSLVAWLNDRFDAVLGRAAPGRPAFDPDAGSVVNEHLDAGRPGPAAPRVQVLPLLSEDSRKGAFRACEARALAAYLRWLVEGRKRTLVDPVTGRERPVEYGDVAVLAASTFALPLLFPELDRLGVPYAARGAALFLSDPLHRQFLLGLRALADRDDGVAQAALLRPPFFALDYDDLARERAADEASPHPGVARARAALQLVADLRRRRLDRSPGATARDLLERTAFARAVALGPNGAQRLDGLRELCLALDTVAATEGLDFDGATARLRAWAVDPVQLDPPRPVASQAVQILSIHQAKGLEFPAVVLWDGCADLRAREARTAFSVDRDGRSWALEIEGLAWEEPEDGSAAAREQRYLDAERLRLVYVAATRARDLLVLPLAGDADPARITGRLLQGAPVELMEMLEPYSLDAEPAWANELQPAPPRLPGDGSALDAEVDARWQAAVAGAARPRFAPAAVTAEAHASSADEESADGEDARPSRPPRASRFGNVFGDTVHRAIGLALTYGLAPDAAVSRAAAATGLDVHVADAVEDVRRALAALERAGLRRRPGPDLQLEYPVAIARDGRLVGGYVDLLGMREGRLVVVDFKTDAPPQGDVRATHAAYVEQVLAYARIVEELGLAPEGTVVAGLLFTAEDEVRWVERNSGSSHAHAAPEARS